VGNVGEAAWIEKIQIETKPQASAQSAPSDALGELDAMIVEAASDPAVLASLYEQLNMMLGRLPPELRSAHVPEFVAIREGRIADIAGDLSSSVAAWIAQAK
jgi:hypothetical protein